MRIVPGRGKLFLQIVRGIADKSGKRPTGENSVYCNETEMLKRIWMKEGGKISDDFAACSKDLIGKFLGFRKQQCLHAEALDIALGANPPHVGKYREHDGRDRRLEHKALSAIGYFRLRQSAGGDGLKTVGQKHLRPHRRPAFEVDGIKPVGPEEEYAAVRYDSTLLVVALSWFPLQLESDPHRRGGLLRRCGDPSALPFKR